MKKILKAGVDGAYALVEPDITFLDLHWYLVRYYAWLAMAWIRS